MLVQKTVILFLLLSITLNAQDYAWPTNASKLMTSSFGEFRPRHFHAAVDIKTWGKTGYKIFAIDDGYIFRIRVASHGYGKAIYLKLKDGNIVVYGHLNGFTPKLNQFTDSLRLARKTNTLDEYIKGNKFPVKKGEHIGYTGETGIGVPHLHFEIRNASNRPINPLKFYSESIKDEIAPTLQKLAIIPENAKSLVNFKPEVLIMNLPRQQRVKISKPVYLSGKAAIVLRSFDRANGANNGFAFYRGRLMINDKLIYEVKYDKFSYANTRLIELDKNFNLWRNKAGVFHNFYRHRKNKLNLYRNTKPGSGILSGQCLKEGLNTIRIEIFDYAGNWAEVEIPIVFHNPEKIVVENVYKFSDSILVEIKADKPIERCEIQFLNNKKAALANSYRLMHINKKSNSYYYNLTIPLEGKLNSDYFRLFAFTNNNIPLLPVYISIDDSLKNSNKQNKSPKWNFRFSRNELVFIRNGVGNLKPVSKSLSFSYENKNNFEYLVLNPDSLEYSGLGINDSLIQEIKKWVQIIPSASGTVSSIDGYMQIDFPVEAVYDTFFCKIDKINISEQYLIESDSYPIKTKIYDVQPLDTPINHGAVINFTLPDSITVEKGLNIYYWDLKKGWRFLPTNFDLNRRTYQARVTSLEKFTVIQDTIPPDIIPLKQSNSNSPVKVIVRDKMSGIYKQKQISVFINENWSLFEFDPEEDLVLISSKDIPPGTNKIKISATDNAGNETIREFKVIN